jgi:hypothetical protein
VALTPEHLRVSRLWFNIRALRPYGDDSTIAGDAVRRAAADLAIEEDGRGFEAFAELAVAGRGAGRPLDGKGGIGIFVTHPMDARHSLKATGAYHTAVPSHARPPLPPTRALRARSIALLQDELVQYLRASEPVVDERDVMVGLALFHDCARRLNADPWVIFDAAAAKVGRELGDLARMFGRRGDITPEAFHFVVAQEPDGPAYRLDSKW